MTSKLVKILFFSVIGLLVAALTAAVRKEHGKIQAITVATITVILIGIFYLVYLWILADPNDSFLQLF